MTGDRSLTPQADDYFLATLLTWNLEPSPLGSTLIVITFGGRADTIVQ